MSSFANLKLAKLRVQGWQLLLLLFLVVFGMLLSTGLSSMSVVWDEAPHLEGGLLIAQGKIGEYATFSRYTPLQDFLTAGYFEVLGVSVASARLVSVTFSLLTIIVVFLFAQKAYGRRVAFVSSAIFATMPGYIWLSRVALLETSLEFFFVSVLLLFLYWLYNGKNRTLLLCGLVLGLAVLDKYQGVVAGLILLAALPLLHYRGELKQKITKLPLLIGSAAAIIVPTIIWSFLTGNLFMWLNLLRSSDPQVNVYGARYPTPVFYLYEMTAPTAYGHPVFLITFLVGLFGLGLLVWRRKPQDRLLLAWFVVVYICFTLIGTKSWRYVLPLFPVIAISAAALLVFLYGRLENVWKSTQKGTLKKPLVKVLAVLLVAFTVGSLAASAVDAYNWLSIDAIYVPLPEAAAYLVNGFDNASQSMMIVCSVNMVNKKLVDFYLGANEVNPHRVVVYPSQPSDAYVLNFNVTEMLQLCRENNVKYLLLYENRGYCYFNSTLQATTIAEIILGSGTVYNQTEFGKQPNRVFIYQVNQTAT